MYAPLPTARPAEQLADELADQRVDVHVHVIGRWDGEADARLRVERVRRAGKQDCSRWTVAWSAATLNVQDSYYRMRPDPFCPLVAWTPVPSFRRAVSRIFAQPLPATVARVEIRMESV